jgi:hypothetical protein
MTNKYDKSTFPLESSSPSIRFENQIPLEPGLFEGSVKEKLSMQEILNISDAEMDDALNDTNKKTYMESLDPIIDAQFIESMKAIDEALDAERDDALDAEIDDAIDAEIDALDDADKRYIESLDAIDDEIDDPIAECDPDYIAECAPDSIRGVHDVKKNP